MTCEELLLLKAKMLCYGVRANRETKKFMESVNRYVLEKSFIHAAHFMIEDLVVNTCIEETFCLKSPFSIELRDGALELFENGVHISKIRVLELPDWCEDMVDIYPIGKYLRPHSPHCVSCWPYLQCHYYRVGKQCQFCSMGSYPAKTMLPSPILPISVIKEMFIRVLRANPRYEIALSGGTCGGLDHSLQYFSEICEQVRNCGANYISVETAPPFDLDYIDCLQKSGATAIIMNLEIAEEALRRIICPGKSSISQTHYFRAYERAVRAFGFGNVSCVLLSGLQDAESIIRKSEELIRIGVIPTIVPFKPLDECFLRDHPMANPNELVMITKEIDRLLHQQGLSASFQCGCTRCNGCSLETIAEQV